MGGTNPQRDQSPQTNGEQDVAGFWPIGLTLKAVA